MQSLETLGKLADVKQNVRSTLDKLKGMKADLVHGNKDWRDWDFRNKHHRRKFLKHDSKTRMPAANVFTVKTININQ